MMFCRAAWQRLAPLARKTLSPLSNNGKKQTFTIAHIIQNSVVFKNKMHQPTPQNMRGSGVGG